MQAYWLVVGVLVTVAAEAASSQKWKIIYFQVLRLQGHTITVFVCGLAL